ncbi:MAG: hypothetical protein LUQ25_07005, partial [Methanoregulaceae archaeon]|nr:hypothetical protein [Methanoregulaceae archaeon]
MKKPIMNAAFAIAFLVGIALIGTVSGTSEPVCSTAINPDTSGNYIAYELIYQQDVDHDIRVKDTSTGNIVTVTFAADLETNPAISGQMVVWQDNRNYATTGWDIYGYDLSTSTETAICTQAGDDINPDISGGRVVWEHVTSGSNHDIYNWTRTGGVIQILCGLTSDQRNPKISGDKVVWEDNRNSATTGWDIYFWDPATGVATDISAGASAFGDGDDINPDIATDIYGYGVPDTVVWELAFSGSDHDIFKWTSSEGATGICETLDLSQKPVITSSDGTIIWEDNRNLATTGWDLYWIYGPFSETQVVLPGDQRNPCIDQEIAW